MLFERVKEISKIRGLSISELEERIGFGKNSIYKWKKQSPKTETLQKVADYLHVSTDYLLGRTDNPYSGISEDQRQLTIEEAINSVMSYDGKPLSDNDRDVLKKIAEAYLDGNL
ncbi:helix-turn-helix domain-containing protein [Enterococcus sp. AZ103]|uniref:helix-turn-helix domain-containing protein n=1 Tax=Enterococcus sp. AZ103 TaxID=2774628 RepID=UPI003F21F084